MDRKKKQTKTDPVAIKKQKQPWWRWLITILAVGLFFFIIYQSRDDFILTMQTASPGLALAGLILLFISRQVVTARWHALLSISDKPINYWETLKLTYAGLFATNFLPTSIGGDLVRFIGMTQLGIDSALVLASLIMDRLVGLVGMSFMVPGGLYLATHTIQPESTLTSMAISINGFLLSINHLWQKFLFFVQKIIGDVLFWLKHPKNLFLSLFFTIIHELLLFGMFWFFLRSVGENISYWTIASLYSLSYLATLIPLSVGGLGIQEMSITYLFSHFGGVSVQAALALAVLSRLAFIINSLPGAFFLPSILREHNKAGE
jgi:glycosyltransferase 2 family protein